MWKNFIKIFRVSEVVYSITWCNCIQYYSISSNKCCGIYFFQSWKRVAFIGGCHLLEPSVYPRPAFIRAQRLSEARCLLEGGIYSRVAFIRGWHLFEGGIYSRVAFIRGWHLFEGGIYSRVAFGAVNSVPRSPIFGINSISWERKPVWLVAVTGFKI